MNLSPLNLPPPEGFLDQPFWDGKNFLIGNSCFPILEYSENFSGWSDDLTFLHESSVGDFHPLDIASRLHAVSQVDKCKPSKNSIIVEIGCSSGFLLRELIELFPFSTIVGVDVVKEPLYKLSKTLPGVPLLRFDLLKCPLPNGCVDVLIMLNVLEHIEDDLTAIKKAYDLLRPGGTMVIEVPACPGLYDGYDAQLLHFRRYSINELKDKLESAGFKVVRISHLGFLIFPIFAIVKMLNKLNGSAKNNTLVQDQASYSSSSYFIKFAMQIENFLQRYISLPFGIRGLITVSKR